MYVSWTLGTNTLYHTLLFGWYRVRKGDEGHTKHKHRNEIRLGIDSEDGILSHWNSQFGIVWHEYFGDEGSMFSSALFLSPRMKPHHITINHEWHSPGWRWVGVRRLAPSIRIGMGMNELLSEFERGGEYSTIDSRIWCTMDTEGVFRLWQWILFFYLPFLFL